MERLNQKTLSVSEIVLKEAFKLSALLTVVVLVLNLLSKGYFSRT